MNVTTFHALRRFAETPSGRIAYIEQGDGPPAVFIHGVPLNGYHWRHVIAGLKDQRRCIALDLMGLGYTEIASTQAVSFSAQAEMVVQFLDALGLSRVDLVANDSGGAVAQIVAARHPGRLRSLTLTNCDVHDNWPPPALAPQLAAAAEGKLLDGYIQYIEDRAGRPLRFARAFADPSVLTDEVYGAYIEPLCATPARRDNFHRYWLAFDSAQTVSIEPQLRVLRVPTLIVWGLDDIFFELKWAHWLKATIPGALPVIEVADAKLFFPEDRPHALLEPLRAFLS